MEYPWRCSGCNHENMVDLENLSEWPLDKLIGAKGFQCEQCGMWEVVGYWTVSLKEQERNLMRYPPTNAKFKFLFAKVLKKAEGVRKHGESLHGEIRHKDLVAAR